MDTILGGGEIDVEEKEELLKEIRERQSATRLPGIQMGGIHKPFVDIQNRGWVPFGKEDSRELFEEFGKKLGEQHKGHDVVFTEDGFRCLTCAPLTERERREKEEKKYPSPIQSGLDVMAEGRQVTYRPHSNYRRLRLEEKDETIEYEGVKLDADLLSNYTNAVRVMTKMGFRKPKDPSYVSSGTQNMAEEIRSEAHTRLIDEAIVDGKPLVLIGGTKFEAAMDRVYDVIEQLVEDQLKEPEEKEDNNELELIDEKLGRATGEGTKKWWANLSPERRSFLGHAARIGQFWESMNSEEQESFREMGKKNMEVFWSQLTSEERKLLQQQRPPVIAPEELGEKYQEWIESLSSEDLAIYHRRRGEAIHEQIESLTPEERRRRFQHLDPYRQPIRLSEEQVNKLQELLLQGYTLLEISEFFGFGLTALKKLIKNLGLKQPTRAQIYAHRQLLGKEEYPESLEEQIREQAVLQEIASRKDFLSIMDELKKRGVIIPHQKVSEE